MVLVDVVPSNWNDALGAPNVRYQLKLWWCKGSLNMLKSAVDDFNEPFSAVAFSRETDYGVSWLIKHLQEVH